VLFAKVVFALAVEGPFDYLVPEDLEKKIEKGSRVLVPFQQRKLIGYVVEISQKTQIKKIKPILSVIDEGPLLSKNMLDLSREFSKYYACSLGQAIESGLPESIRDTRIKLTVRRLIKENKNSSCGDILLIQDRDKFSRWQIYKKEINHVLSQGKSVIFLNTDLEAAKACLEDLRKSFACPIVFLQRGNLRQNREDWLKVRNHQVNIVIGVRSAIFAPLHNLGLIIIDEEESENYKNDQTPHYHARQVAFMRAKIEKAKVILGSLSPSLESMRLAQTKKIDYLFLQQAKQTVNVQILDIRRERRLSKTRNFIFCESLVSAIQQTLNEKGKVLIFASRRGFATFAYCRNCGLILQCPRCSVNLAYHFKEKALRCRYCNYSIASPAVCPQCNASYIRYTGIGEEKIESELQRLMPVAKINRIDKIGNFDVACADIFVSTQTILKLKNVKFDLVAAIGIDTALERVDFRAAEKTFFILSNLFCLSAKNLFIQTALPTHHCFTATAKNDPRLFYEKELFIRKQAGFVPFSHFIIIKLRSRKEEKAKDAAKELFSILTAAEKEKRPFKPLSVSPGQPAKIRDNFYWQILLKCRFVEKAILSIKETLKEIKHSGIIITIDVDPL